jgi:predicted dehydrogenase
MPVRVGFVGAGGIAGAHMNALEKVENAKIVAFADVDEARARRAAERFGAASYTDYKEMFANEDLQAVYFCLPPLAHAEAEILAAQKGLALFVEKPVAINMEKAREIRAAIEESGVVSAVGYHWRNYDVTDRVRAELEGKTIGMAMGYWMGGLPGVWWWRKMDGSGGQMVEQTTHIVDLARYLVGEVRTVYAAYALRALQETPDLDVPDVGTMTLQFENGAVGHVANACLLNTGYTTGLNILTPDLIVEHRAGTVKLIRPHETTELKTRVNPTVVEDQHFINAVEGGDRGKIRSPYADAVKTLAVTLAGNVSAQRGEPVQVEEILGG